MITTSEAILYGVPVLILLVLIVFTVFRRLKGRRNRGPDFGLTAGDLKGLEQKSLLTKEEMKAVRQAMARQYLDHEKTEEETAALTKAQNALEALALEAQKADEELRRKRAAAAAGARPPEAAAPAPAAASPALPATPPAEEPPAPAAPPAPKVKTPEDDIPEELRPYLDKPEQEIEDLMNAGFLDPADAKRIMELRRRCRECGD